MRAAQSEPQSLNFVSIKFDADGRLTVDWAPSPDVCAAERGRCLSLPTMSPASSHGALRKIVVGDVDLKQLSQNPTDQTSMSMIRSDAIMLRKLLILPLALSGCNAFSKTCLETGECGPGSNAPAAGDGGGGGSSGEAGSSGDATGGTAGSAPTVAGISFDGIDSLEVHESGTTVSFGVRLDTEPTSTVALALESSDASEGSVSPATVSFTPSNWNVEQNVSVGGIEDVLIDGDVDFEVTLEVESSDADYSALDLAAIPVINVDNDAAGAVFVGDTPLVTHELAIGAEFTLALSAQPTADVTLTLSASDPTEGTLEPGTLVFTPGAWNIPQSVTVTGVPETGRDDGVTYGIAGTFTSDDEDFSRAAMSSLPVLNRDFDVRRVQVGDEYAMAEGVSADGSRVAFVSYSLDGGQGLYLYDAATDRSEIVTEGDFDEVDHAISGDGSTVVFSTESKLLSADLNSVRDVYAYDVANGTFSLISGTPSGSGSGASYGPEPSEDGRYVAFASSASDLVESDSNDDVDILVADRDTGEIERMSVSDAGQQTSGTVDWTSISADGCKVTFQSTGAVVDEFPPSGGAVRVYLRDRCAEETSLVSVAAGVPGDGNGARVSGDGKLVTFVSASNEFTGASSVFDQVIIRTPAVDRNSIVSADPRGNIGDDDSRTPSISGDGRFVAFYTNATNVLPAVSPAKNICVRDTLVRRTRCLPNDVGGVLDEDTGGPQITADGTKILFVTHASNVMPDTKPGTISSYVMELGDAFWNSPLIPEAE
jgi:Tol biopolymer transport system component